MPDLGPHAVYIVWSYIGVAITCAALIGWVWWDSRAVKSRLAALEAKGVRRRSSGPA